MPTSNSTLYNSWMANGSGFGNAVHIDDEATSSTSAGLRDTQVRSPTHSNGTPMFLQGGNDGVEDWPPPRAAAEIPFHTTQSPFLNDPTLAPELSFDDMDLNAMLQTPGNVPTSRCAPHEVTLQAKSSVDNELTASNVVDEHAYDAGVHWGYDFSGYAADHPIISTSSADIQATSGLEFSDIDLGLAPAQDAMGQGSMSIDPFLPGLHGSQLGILDENSLFAMDYVSPTPQYRGADASLTSTYPLQYPDPEDFNTPVSSTPGLTSATTTPSGQQGLRCAQRDTSKDALLVRLRQDGKSYKQIKEIGGFEEAESTLRGRYRTLVKPKEARVRKPEWRDRDIQLLLQGVTHFSNSNPISLGAWHGLDADAIHQFTNKVPWKQVAEWMEDQGTYKFGNSTVKKQYLAELKKRGAPV
ncbi:hypothetical protein A1O7_07398 [Cladophialophora yegresii CBS 114405]|uniref:Myb-like domain-containing protein n=1 Tax=Cladophialophora yegresii CBS 114405 TaxID=1182544 RepID=W9WEV1_9EURO|nr:uncharacterized protein A1O7_07398 [Cladophialophora yegresii CBS 114405]EXJ57054.1 hypothetical protein A1O7_07398 [Cladophialophora yegresii CBS 114405]